MNWVQCIAYAQWDFLALKFCEANHDKCCHFSCVDTALLFPGKEWWVGKLKKLGLKFSLSTVPGDVVECEHKARDGKLEKTAGLKKKFHCGTVPFDDIECEHEASDCKLEKTVKRAFVGAGARVLFYPILLYNVVRNKLQPEFRWWDQIDQVRFSPP